MQVLGKQEGKYLTEKERLWKVLNREKVDRQPCICPGGMMNMITTDLMQKCGVVWPNAHTDAQMMADLALASYQNGCFENVGVPFCMTVEAEHLGAEVTMGTDIFEPHVTTYALKSILEWEKIKIKEMHRGREQVVLDAIRILKSKNLDVPIVGNITGPISTASSVLEPVAFYKSLRKHKEEVHLFMKFVTEHLIDFAKAQIAVGADVIAISDPSGTGEILGPKLFEEYAVKYLNMLLEGLKEEKVGTIVHICGQMKSVYEKIDMVQSDVLSFDSVVPMKEARKNLPERVLMGNVSTYTLEFGKPEKVAAFTRSCVSNGADIISPACGLGTKSPLKNIQIMLKTLKENEVAEDA